jgi:hypothetical protein
MRITSIPPIREAVWSHALCLYWQQEELGTEKSSTISPWIGVLFFPVQTAYPWLAYDRPSWLRLGVVMAKSLMAVFLTTEPWEELC